MTDRGGFWGNRWRGETIVKCAEGREREDQWKKKIEFGRCHDSKSLGRISIPVREITITRDGINGEGGGGKGRKSAGNL